MNANWVQSDEMIDQDEHLQKQRIGTRQFKIVDWDLFLMIAFQVIIKTADAGGRFRAVLGIDEELQWKACDHILVLISN